MCDHVVIHIVMLNFSILLCLLWLFCEIPLFVCFVFLKFPLLCHWKFVDYFQSRFCSQGPSIWPKVFENANLGLVWNVIFFLFTNIRMHKVFVEASKYYMCIYLKLTITVGAGIFLLMLGCRSIDVGMHLVYVLSCFFICCYGVHHDKVV